jgi:serine/threonine-protein kinase
MGEVHEAWDVVLCRTVALKVLKNIEPAALIRFMHEAQMHARVVHPNICRIYDVDNYEGTLRVAMQLVRGPNLEQACRELTVQEGVGILILVAQAVHVVHRLNLIHRDLKPSNILLERCAEGPWIPYVCDFGLAMALDDPPLTYSHGVLGTPAYMAPEQFQGERSRISPATDVFALGGTLHFALTGRPPAPPYGVRHANVNDPAIPRDLRLIIGKCLEPDPENRYPTASALAEDMCRYLEGSPIRATVRNPVFRRRLRRAKPYLLAAAAGVLVAAGGWIHVGRLQERAQAQRILAQSLILDLQAMVGGYQLELTRPVHDLHPTLALIRRHQELFRAKLRDLDPEWRGQGYYALGAASCLLGQYSWAEGELGLAWNGGCQNVTVAALLAQAVLENDRATAGATLDPGRQARPPDLRDRQAQDRLRQVMGQNLDFFPGAETLMARLSKDPARAIAASRAVRLVAPWRFQAARMESEDLQDLAQQNLEAGGLAHAKEYLRQALEAAQEGLAIAPSYPGLHHAYLRAALRLAALEREDGPPPLASLARLKDACDRARILDPDRTDLQDDWLALRWLNAQCLADQGQDPEPELTAAQRFLATRALQPLAPALQADRMVVAWLKAERDLDRGLDPGPDLDPALSQPVHTPGWSRDYYWDLQICKARAEAARNLDPRPTLDALQESLRPWLQEGPSWPLEEAACQAWLVRADWETAHRLDPGASIRNARVLAETACGQGPDSASAHALEGLALVRELRAFPRERSLLVPRAWESLRLALALAPKGRLQACLQRELRGGLRGRPGNPAATGL